jgi:hypothetical protein
MMTHTLTKGLNQNPAMIKDASPATPFRGFALWLALLVLYFLLLPSAADTPSQAGAGNGQAFFETSDQKIDQTVSVASRYRRQSQAQRR